MTNNSKPLLLSGIQPSGNLMIANYIGAIRNWVDLQNQYNCYFMLADLHAITVTQEPQDLLKNCYDFIALYIACGINPDQNTIFVQSHVSGHAELAWLLNCYTQMGELNRMTQFKDKSQKHAKNINVGLYSYPVLMAADILLYNADLVPVGHDQKQHLELTRDIANRINNRYGELFTIPEPYIAKSGARIMSLQDPNSKMSKSDKNVNNYIGLLDDPKVIMKKFKKAVTDSGDTIRYEPETKPAISNLIEIRHCVTGESIADIEKNYEGKMYGHLKIDLAEAVIEFLQPVQERFNQLRQDNTELNIILKRGQEEANKRAETILNKMRQTIGFIPNIKNVCL